MLNDDFEQRRDRCPSVPSHTRNDDVHHMDDTDRNDASDSQPDLELNSLTQAANVPRPVLLAWGNLALGLTRFFASQTTTAIDSLQELLAWTHWMAPMASPSLRHHWPWQLGSM